MAFPFTTPPTNRLTVSSLLSPPERKRSDSFGTAMALPMPPMPPTPFHTQPSAPSTATLTPKMALGTRAAYASPPISPYDAQSRKENMDGRDEDSGRDPQLFVPSPANPIALDEPLFPQENVDPMTRDMITKHMESTAFASLREKPAREDYELTVSFVGKVFASYNRNPRAWYAQEREFDKQYARRSVKDKKKTALKRLAPAPVPGARNRQKMALPRLPRAQRPVSRGTPHVQQQYDFMDVPFTSPKPTRPATNRDDTDYNTLPDFAPPLDSLPKGNNKILKADWKGQMLDLSNDPDRHMLHEAEVTLASTLRLSCATYLCSKRRIFQARIDALKIGKEFRKTDAQQACKIDVNKASKLWQAYDRVGWFRADYFTKFA